MEMTDDETIEFERLKTARDSLLLTVANLRGQLETIAADEREACAKLCDEKVDAEYATGKVDHNEMGWTQSCAIAIRARGQA
jgi:hypothetical protein